MSTNQLVTPIHKWLECDNGGATVARVCVCNRMFSIAVSVCLLRYQLGWDLWAPHYHYSRHIACLKHCRLILQQSICLRSARKSDRSRSQIQAYPHRHPHYTPSSSFLTLKLLVFEFRPLNLFIYLMDNYIMFMAILSHFIDLISIEISTACWNQDLYSLFTYSRSIAKIIFFARI